MKNEIDSKALLARYGIPTTEPRLVRSPGEAVAAAEAVGAPVAMKVVSPDIVHKAQLGGVRLHVSPTEAAVSFEAIMQAVYQARPEAKLEGVLIERMAPDGMEAFIGARIDPEFGAVVLVGHGGTGVEHGPAPAAALAPISPKLANDLIEQAFGTAIETELGPAARQALHNALLATAGADGMLVRERIDEIDVNPLILHREGALAVDAVVGEATEEVAKDHRAAVAARRARLVGLGALFDPESIAVVGASNTKGKLGYRLVRLQLDAGYAGAIYPIHPTAQAICGIAAYPSIDAVPGPVDRAFVAVAAPRVPKVLEACANKGVKVAQVLTAGFAEYAPDAETEDGARLEQEMRDALAGSSLRMVGPNCIGTFSASSRIAIGPARYAPAEPGGITFFSQSGTFACDVVRRAQVQGLPVGRVLSAGNCSDLDIVDYLLFCEDDPNTTLSAFYVESLRDPGLFFRIAAEATKPIVMMKGGTTDQGVSAASSHTAALATDSALWEAGIRQAGILQVDNIDELMDALLIHSAHGQLEGNRLGIFGSGGGVSVTASDAASRAGMAVPTLSTETGAALRRFGVPGTSVANPIDIPVWGLRDGEDYVFDEIVNLLKTDPAVDSIIVYIETGSIMDFADDESDGLGQLEEICASVARARSEGPKISLVLRSSGDRVQDDLVRDQRRALLPKGIAVFPSTARAVRAHAKLLTMTRRGATEPTTIPATAAAALGGA